MTGLWNYKENKTCEITKKIKFNFVNFEEL